MIDLVRSAWCAANNEPRTTHHALCFRNNHLNHFVALLDAVDDGHVFGDFAKDRVLTVQMGLRRMGDKKLAAVGAGASVCH